MVQNPIYDGPVYESVQTHFDLLTTQVTAAADNSCAKCPSLSMPASVDNIKYRYISQPDSGTNESEPMTKEHTEDHIEEHLTGTSMASNGCMMQHSKYEIQ
jgi:hypothetical protein